MNWWSRLVRRKQLEEELDKELRFHLDQHADDLIAHGSTPNEARRQARLYLGGPEQVKEKCRDARGARWLEDLIQDLRYGIRTLRLNPGFAIVAVLSLSLGIGANTAVFSVLCGELFPKLSYRDSGTLVKIVGIADSGGTPVRLSDAEFRSVQSSVDSFDEVASASIQIFHLTDGVSEPERLVGLGISPNFLSFLGVSPVLGRDFSLEEGRPGSENVAILSEGFWRSRYAGSRAILGRRVTLNEQPYTVVGVVPSDPWLLRDNLRVYVPLAADAAPASQSRSSFIWDVYGRLQRGLSVTAAQSELEAGSPRWASSDPESNRARRLHTVPVVETVFVDRAESSERLLLLQTTVGFVLLITCINVGCLLLAHATSRRYEFALRVALGAGRTRILRQLMTESAPLVALAGLGGMLLSFLGTRVIANVWGFHQTTFFDARVLVFTSAAVIATAILCCLAPAYRVLEGADEAALKERGRAVGMTRRSHRLLDALVLCEIGIALGLLVSAGVLVKSLGLRLQTTPGFATANLLLARTHFLGEKYTTAEARARFIRRALDEVAVLPGVRAATVVDPYPPSGEQAFPILTAGSQTFGEPRPTVRHRSATSGYFRTLSVKVLRGRDFSPRDEGTEPGKAIINEAMARRFWSDVSPIGRLITTNRDGQVAPLQVIGVVATGDNNLAYHPEPQAEIVELSAVPSEAPWFMIRTDAEPLQLVPMLRQAVHNVDPNQPLAAFRTVENWIAQESSGHRALAEVLAAFAGIALALVAIGVYGTLSHVAALRRNEVGVRIALGARPGMIVRLFLMKGIRLVLIAFPLGLVASWILTRWMSALLFGVGFAEPKILVSTTLFLISTVLLAALGPAWRCSRVDPASALRAE